MADIIYFPGFRIRLHPRGDGKPKKRHRKVPMELVSAEFRRRSEMPSREEAIRDAWLIEQGYFRRRTPHYLGVPDLDKMTPGELDLVYMTFGHSSHASREVAEALVGDRRPNYTKIARYIGHYASNRRTALRLREAGNEDRAAFYSIPDDLKWERHRD